MGCLIAVIQKNKNARKRLHILTEPDMITISKRLKKWIVTIELGETTE